MNSVGAIVDCTLRVVGELDLKALPAEEIRGAIGLSRDESLDRLFPDLGPADRRRIVERSRHHWITTYRDRPVMIEGVRETLEELAEAGYLLAVATGKSRAGLDRELETTGLAELILASRTADEAASKPHPQMLLDLMDELGTKPRETLMVGDTTFDLLMAKNAGSPGVGVLSGSHDQTTLLECEPLHVLASAAELPSWLRGQGTEPRRK